MALSIGRIIAVRSALALGAAACLFTLGGCSRFDWQGRWTGSRDFKALPGDNPVVARSVSMVDLRINGNGTFDLFDCNVPRSGFVSYGSNRAYLEPKTAYGSQIELLGAGGDKFKTEIELTPLPDGRIRMRDSAGLDPSPVTLSRTLQPGGPAVRTN